MILVINTCHHPLHYFEFVKPIEDTLHALGQEFDTQHYNTLEPSALQKAGSIIICGSSLQDFGYLKHLDKFSFLKDLHKPVLGICAGMQIMCMVLGCKLEKDFELGQLDVEFKGFLGIHGCRSVYAMHGMAIKEDGTFKDNFSVLARTGHAQVIKHISRPLYAVMFHPEARNRDIIERFIQTI